MEQSTQSQPDAEFKISIVGKGVAIEKTVSAALASTIISMLMTGAAAPGLRASSGNSTVGQNEPGAGGGRRRTSIREFLDDQAASRNPDKITAIAVFIEQVEGKETFSKEDVKLKFPKAGEAVPGNFTRDFAWAIQSGWIAEDPQVPGSFYVTQKGHAAVTAKFSKDVQKKLPQDRRGRKKDQTESAETEGA